MTIRSRDLPGPASALAIAAHPDDAEFGAAATLAKWSARGAVVHHLVCTDGSKGSWDPHEDTGALVAVRQDEQRAAAAIIAASGETVFLGRVDGELTADQATADEIARCIRRLRPTIVLAHDPWRRYRLHPDHHAAGVLAVNAIVAARDPHFDVGEPLDPWRPDTLLLFEADRPDHLEDVTGHGDAKVAALMAHRSQLRSTMEIETGSAEEEAQTARFERRILDELARHGRRIAVRHAEPFRLLPP